MSALRRNNKIQIAMQLRWQLCVLAVPAAVLSALSISVFCHMRENPHANAFMCRGAIYSAWGFNQ